MLPREIEYSASPPEDCVQGACDPLALSASYLVIMADLNLPVRFIAGFFTATNLGLALGFFAIAGVIAWRKSADPMGLLSSFGATARDEVDIDRVSAALLAVVKDAIHPEHVSLWL